MGRVGLGLLVVGLLGLLGVYGAQAGLGHWQIDEFRYFGDHRVQGWMAYPYRFETSPRPFSEALIFGYGSAVLGSGRALVAAALLTVWGGCVAGMVAAGWVATRGAVGEAVALGVAPMVFGLVTGPVTEMFYWPVATAAYVPMVAAVTAVLLLLGDVPGPVRRRWCGVALGLAALSHEIGAAFAIGFGGVGAVLAVRRREDGVWWWAGPAVAGAAVMLALVVFRSHFVDLGADTKPYTGRLLASAAAAVRQMAVDAGTSPAFGTGWGGVAAAVAQKVAFAAGLAAIWVRAGGVRAGGVRANRWQAAVAAGLVVAVFFSLLAAFYHYGDLCCERQAASRQWLIELILVLGASVVVARWRGGLGWAPWLVMASLSPVVLQVPAMRADFALLGMAREARARTWASGAGAGPAMEFYMPPDGGELLIHGTSMPVGRYDLADGTVGVNDLVGGVGSFFGKTVVFACQPWQSHQSFLIDGTRFVPACPPHDGPPDVRFNTR